MDSHLANDGKYFSVAYYSPHMHEITYAIYYRRVIFSANPDDTTTLKL